MPEEDALGAGPFGGQGGGGFEDPGGVGEEAAVPEVGAAALEDVEELRGVGLGRVGVGTLEVEGEGAAGLVLAVEDDEVVGVDLGGDGFG